MFIQLSKQLYIINTSILHKSCANIRVCAPRIGTKRNSKQPLIKHIHITVDIVWSSFIYCEFVLFQSLGLSSGYIYIYIYIYLCNVNASQTVLLAQRFNMQMKCTSSVNGSSFFWASYLRLFSIFPSRLRHSAVHICIRLVLRLG